MATREQQPLHALLAAPHWRPLRAAAEAAVAEARVDAAALRRIDRWLAHKTENGLAHVTADDLDAFVDGRSRAPVARLREALAAIDPNSVEIEVCHRVELTRRRRRRPPTSARQSRHTVSLAIDELPGPWRAALADMRAGRRRGCRPPAADIVTSIEQRLAWLAWSCARRDMPLTLDRRGLRALVEDLLGRRVRNRTLAGTMDVLRRFGTYIGIDEQLRADIDDERRYWLREYADDAKIKELFLLRSGLRLEDLVAAANRLSQRASTARSRRDAVAGWNAAALIILQLCRPLRLQDTMGLRLHRDLVRDSEGWTFDELVTRKAKVPVDERLWPIATPFLDELILLGRDESQLWRRYADLVGAPLFRRSDGEPYAARWASQVFQREFGTGVHITRTLLHDHAAGHGPNGVRQAMALAGQIGARTAEEYQTSATRRRAVREGQARMGTLLDAALA